MAEWNPEQYMRFKEDRLRPARELLARVDIRDPNIVVDLGCGPATTTQILRERFGKTRIIGVDNSHAMIERARNEMASDEFVLGDIGKWEPPENVDLLYSNAVFHWMPNHEKLLTRLSGMLNSGGVLAFQMPNNLGEPSHLAIAELAQSARWEILLADQMAQRTQVASDSQYHDWLAVDFEKIDIWQTTYSHTLPSHQHIVDWVKGAALTPYLGKLNEDEAGEFLDDYLTMIKKSYRVQKDGTVIFPFPRLFVVANKSN